jgi:hypothetical protein
MGRSSNGLALSLKDAMAESEVRALLGEPIEVSELDSDSSEWRYYKRTQPKGDVVKLLGLITVSTPAERSIEVRIVVRHNVVDSIRIRRWE